MSLANIFMWLHAIETLGEALFTDIVVLNRMHVLINLVFEILAQSFSCELNFYTGPTFAS